MEWGIEGIAGIGEVNVVNVSNNSSLTYTLFLEVTGFAAVLAVGACERYRGVKDGYKQSLCPQQMKIHVAINRDGKV